MQRHRCHSRSRRRIGRILPVLMALFVLPLAAGIAAAQEAPQAPVKISASHAVTGSVDQGDGTYSVTCEVTLTNNSGTNLNNISLTPESLGIPVYLDPTPSLDAASLPAGDSVTVTWTAQRMFPGDSPMVPKTIFFTGSATDDSGADVSVFSISTEGAGQ